MNNQWMAFLIVTVLSSLSFAAKKNVCSITLNSSEEIELFKAKLSPKDFNFTELTLTQAKKANATNEEADSEDEGSTNRDWLMESCRQQIKCDILVVSGHFGGTFFGKSGLNLPMEDLEKASCEDSCSGIIKRPKEVFLFGCNTLSGKEKDNRTPEQYIQVLVNDGFTQEQAQQVAAFRYSSFGSSFNDRMKRTFTGVPRIYGFTSIGPSGKTSSPLLKNYLNQTAPQYSQYISKVNSDLNKPLLTAFKNTAIAQAEGEKSGNTAVCYLGSSKVATRDKLAYVADVATKGGMLQIAPHVVNLFKSLIISDMSVDEKAQMEKIRSSENGKKQVLAFTQEPIAGLIKPQVDILNLSLQLQWVDKAKYDKLLSAIALKPIYSSRDFTIEVKDQICSLEIKVGSIDTQKIKANSWSNAAFIDTLNCLKVSSSDVVQLVKASLFKNSSLDSLRASAMNYLSNVALPQNIVAEIAEFQIDQSKGNSTKINEVTTLTINQKYHDLKLAGKVYNMMSNTSVSDQKANLFEVYFQLISGHEESVNKSIDYLFNDSKSIYETDKLITDNVAKVFLANDKLKLKLFSFVADRKNTKKLAKALIFLKKHPFVIDGIDKVLINALKDNSIGLLPQIVILIYLENNLFNDFVKANLLEIYGLSNSPQILEKIISVFKRHISEDDLFVMYSNEKRGLPKFMIRQVFTEAYRSKAPLDTAAYSREVMDYLHKMPRAEFNDHRKNLHEVDSEDEGPFTYISIVPGITSADIQDYLGKKDDDDESRYVLLSDMSLVNFTVLLNKKTSAFIAIEDVLSCGSVFRVRGETDCIYLRTRPDGIFETRLSVYRYDLTYGLFHFDAKAEKVDWTAEKYSDLLDEMNKKIAILNPKYKDFFEDHILEIENVIQESTNRYKFTMTHANRGRLGDGKSLTTDVMVDFKTLPDGSQGFTIVKIGPSKYEVNE